MIHWWISTVDSFKEFGGWKSFIFVHSIIQLSCRFILANLSGVDGTVQLAPAILICTESTESNWKKLRRQKILLNKRKQNLPTKINQNDSFTIDNMHTSTKLGHPSDSNTKSSFEWKNWCAWTVPGACNLQVYESLTIFISVSCLSMFDWFHFYL